MKRDPSIHITKSSFRKILQDMEIKFPVEDFFVKARQVSVDARIIAATSRKITKKVNNITLASNGDANLAADILYSVQIQLKHRGVKKIDENNRQWSLIKKLADVCNTFCHDFGLETRAGYIKYIKIGFSRMQGNHKNYLNRLISMAQNITDSFQATDDINHDESPIETANIHDYYCKVIADRAGFKVDYHNQPETYIYFVRLREFCQANGIDPEVWIDAQFEGLAWCNGFPDPDKLLGDKAKSYYAKFQFKNNKAGDEPKVFGSLWDKIKQDD